MSLYEELVMVSGLGVFVRSISKTSPIKNTHGMPFCAENDGQVSFAFPWDHFVSALHIVSNSKVRTVGFAGQQPPSPKEATLPNAAASFQPAQG